MNSARRSGDKFIRARLLRGGLWSPNSPCPGMVLTQRQQLVSHRFLYTGQDYGENRKPALGREDLSWSVGENEITFAKYLKHQVRRFTVSTKSNRNVRFDKLKETDVQHFKCIVGEGGAILDKDELALAKTDWLQKYQGHSQVLLRPKTTQQVSDILQHCNARNLAVVPQGGNTGLVGGGVPVYDEVIVNLGAMNKIIS